MTEKYNRERKMCQPTPLAPTTHFSNPPNIGHVYLWNKSI